MSFSLCTLLQSYQSFSLLEEMPILSTPQIVTGLIDIVAIVGAVALAVLMLVNSAHSHPLGLAPTPHQILPFILLGGAGAFALGDLITLAIQTSKKFNALKTLKAESQVPHAVNDKTIVIKNQIPA